MRRDAGEKRERRPGYALWLALLMTACPGPPPAAPELDGAVEAVPDSGVSTELDSGVSTELDSGVSTELDGGVSMEPDSGAPSPDAGEAPPSGFPALALCPSGPKPSIPAEAPRILILRGSRSAGVSYGPLAIGDLAGGLRALLSADPAFDGGVVDTVDIATSTTTSLVSWYYAPEGRSLRLAPLSGPWSYVVLLDDPMLAVTAPELHFEGVRAVGCLARAAGATPVILTSWGPSWEPVSTEVAYRVGNGTGLPVVPAGEAWHATADVWGPGSYARSTFVAAATLYSALTGRDAASAPSPYVPATLTLAQTTQLSGLAHATVLREASQTHYSTPFEGVVELRPAQRSAGEFWFMDSGTSSEALWRSSVTDLVSRLGFTPRATSIGVTNPLKAFDAACLTNAQPWFQAAPYGVLFARDYQLEAASIRAAGAQPDLQVQVWDRHADGAPLDGLAEVTALEARLLPKIQLAQRLGLALIPHHLAFARLKTERPAINLTSDGTHATAPVTSALATMSIVSRLGLHLPTTGLDPDLELGARIGEELIRQLSSLSATGEFVSDLPSSRPSLHP